MVVTYMMNITLPLRGNASRKRNPSGYSERAHAAYLKLNHLLRGRRGEKFRKLSLNSPEKDTTII